VKGERERELVLLSFAPVHRSLKLLTGATWCNERKGKTGMVFLGNEGSCLVVWRLFRSELMVISLVGCGSGVWFIVHQRNSEKEKKMGFRRSGCLLADLEKKGRLCGLVFGGYGA